MEDESTRPRWEMRGGHLSCFVDTFTNNTSIGLEEWAADEARGDDGVDRCRRHNDGVHQAQTSIDKKI